MKKQERTALRAGAWLAVFTLYIVSVPVGYAPLQAEAATLQQKYELLDDVQNSAILHCWNWSYETIEENMQLIAECGYSAIQTSPCTQPKDYTYDGVVGTDVGTPGVGGTGNWWKLYQPVTFSVCDNGQTWLGTKEELESMCEKAEEYGIKVIVDVVANHMGNIKGWQNSLSDVSPQVGTYWNEDMLTDESYWHINDYQTWMSDSRLHFTQGTMGMPDLNTGDSRVQAYVADYLDELIDCGVDGFRFDAAKHIETPDDDPSFASDFWPNVLGEAESHYKAVTGDDLYVYGEVLNTVGDNFSIDSYTKYMTVTDNSAGNHLLEAFRNNNVGTLSMDYAPEVSLLWAESHDTFMNESSRYASDKSIVRTWAMVANKDNASALFFARPYTSAEILENDQDGCMKSNLAVTLVQAQMGECESYVWASKEVAAINHFNNRMKDQSDEMGSDGNVAYCKRGNGIVLASFNGAETISMSSHGLADGTYTDEVSRNTFTVSGGVLRGTITSEYGIAVIYQNVMDNPSANYPVQITCDKADGTTFYTDGLEVTLSESYAYSASYRASTGESGTFSGTSVVTIGQGLKAGESVTLTVTASNSKGKQTKTYTFYRDEYDLTDCIFFENTNDWDNVTAYLWNDEGTTVATNASWPGEAMYACDTKNRIYALKIDTSAGYNKVIFSNKGASQTADLAFEEVGYLYHPSSGTWTEYVADTVKTPTITANEESKKFTDSITVTYTVENATSATISVNGKEEAFSGSITKTLTGSSTVTITAVNEKKSVTKEFTYTKVESVETTTLYLNISACSWFTNEKAVPAIKTDGEETYAQMSSFVNAAGETIYTAKISGDATAATVVRMLPSGNVCNAVTFSVNQGKDYFTGDSNWSQVTASKYEEPEEAEMITVYFVNNYEWSKVYAYAWGGSVTTSTWPGDAMEYVGTNASNQKIYKIPIAGDSTGLIFNNGAGSQTVDITSGISDGTSYMLSGCGSKLSVVAGRYQK